MDKEAIREELNKVRADIKSLKSSFSKKRNDKETHFKLGEEYSEKINSLYEEVKKIESENNLEKINTDLDEKKVEFEEFKSKLEVLEKTFAEMRKSAPKSDSKTNFRDNNSRGENKPISVDKARKEIKQLELQLQTQVLSLDKESDLIKKVSQLKGLIQDVKGESSNSESSDGNDEFKTVKKELNSTRRKFNAIEKKIRSLYKQIRLISKEKKQRYKEIDALRDQKKESFEEFRSHKKEYSTLGKDLKDLFTKEDELLTSLGESPAIRKKTFDKELKNKQKEVEDNFLKKGGKLTTEDLLLFQKK